MSMLAKAPMAFTIVDQDGRQATLAHYLSVKYRDPAPNLLLLYFYPKDGTPGCTQQACSLRNTNAELRDLGVAIVGVSGDSEASHRKFAIKHRLDFPLVADTDHALAKAFGVYKPKRIFGKEVFGTLRTSFLIDANGKILHVWDKVNTAGHGAEVVAVIRQLKI